MKNILRLLSSSILTALFAVAAQAANLVPAAYTVGKVEGEVSYKLAGSSDYMPLASGTALPQGVTVKTGADSKAIIVFASGSLAAVTANSEIEFTKFEQEAFSGAVVADAEPAVSHTEIKVINGDVVSKVNKLKKGSNYTVNSPVGAAGVRGTTFKVSYNATTGAYSIQVVEGEVVLATVTGQTVPVRSKRQAVKLDNSDDVVLSDLPPAAEIQIGLAILFTAITDPTVFRSLFNGNPIVIEVDVTQTVSPN